MTLRTLQPPARRGRLRAQGPRDGTEEPSTLTKGAPSRTGAAPTGQSAHRVRQNCSSGGQPPVKELAPACPAFPETHTPATQRETTLCLDPPPPAWMPLPCLLQLHFPSKEALSESFRELSRGIHCATRGAAGSAAGRELARTGGLASWRAGGARVGAGGRPQQQARRKRRKAGEPPGRDAGTRISGLRRTYFVDISPAGFECRSAEMAAASRSEAARRSHQRDVR